MACLVYGDLVLPCFYYVQLTPPRLQCIAIVFQKLNFHILKFGAIRITSLKGMVSVKIEIINLKIYSI